MNYRKINNPEGVKYLSENNGKFPGNDRYTRVFHATPSGFKSFLLLFCYNHTIPSGL
ncbi:MAG: hypothetical protein JETT_1369 [Candidatus Jettenia ecosi]|uniref:Uncharacterized protein n=1 Tax=Candidatus Jettenia ecosi TaxID=2494326 RepID=A0A533Q5R9_9BACT|nr:MAG: hypothetical protein JETT_3853 [Candidatus Jettenia ecosi]TLD42337.1 MAG: hypothetical protein JETT_1369 [Candidatus Jettenia ecosi]